MTARIRRSKLEGVSEADFAYVVAVHARDLREHRDHHAALDAGDDFLQPYPVPWTIPLVRSAINNETMLPDFVIIDSRGQAAMKIFARLALVCALALIPTIAVGQSSPGLAFGQVPTAAQWNGYFAAKQDYLGFTPLNPSSLLGTAPISVSLGGGTATISLAACSASGQVLLYTSAWACSATIILNANSAAVPAPQAGNVIHLNGADATNAIVEINAYAAASAVNLDRANGTGASPTGIVSSNNAGVINFRGYDTSTYSTAAVVRGTGTETWSPTAHGMLLDFLTVQNTTTAQLQAMRINASGGVWIGSTAGDPGVGSLQTETSLISPLAIGGTAAGSTLALRSTSGTGTTDAIILQTGTNGANEGMRVVTGGQIVRGHTAALSFGAVTPGVQINAISGSSNALLSPQYWSNDAFGPVIHFLKSRGTTVGSYTIVQNNDTLGVMQFGGAPGSSTITYAAAVLAAVDGTPGASNDMPGRLVFQTTPDGSGTLTERLRISNTGHTNWSGTTPGLTSCGTSPAITGNDMHGTVTMGTAAPTGCVITFALAYAAAPTCRVTWRTNIASMQYTVSTSAITLTQTATSSNLIDYDCWGA